MSEITLQNVNEAVNELRELVTKGANVRSDDKEKMDKIEKFLDEQEAKNKELISSLSLEKKFKEDLKDRLDTIEKEVSRKAVHGTDKAKKLEMEQKSVVNWLSNKMTADDIKTLRTDEAVSGGILVPEEMVMEIIKKITEVSPMLQLARVVPQASKTSTLPKRTTILSSGYGGELDNAPVSNSKYGAERIVMRKQHVQCELSREDIMFSAFDMESEVMGDVTEEFNQMMNRAFTIGSGVNYPQGFATVEAGVPTINSGISNDITPDNLIDLHRTPKTGYSGVFGMNRFTIAKLRKEKGGDGHYIWVAGNIAAGIPNTFDGVPYYEFPDLADYNTPNGIAVVYADFRRMYRIGIAKQITMLKDESSQAVAAKGKIVLTFDQFNGGAVVLPEAGALLKVST